MKYTLSPHFYAQGFTSKSMLLDSLTFLYREWWIGLSSEQVNNLNINAWAEGEPSGDGGFLHLFSAKDYLLNDIQSEVTASQWSIAFAPICQMPPHDGISYYYFRFF